MLVSSTIQITVGTYGQELLVYGATRDGDGLRALERSRRDGGGGGGGGGGGRGIDAAVTAAAASMGSRGGGGGGGFSDFTNTDRNGAFELSWQRRFPCPIYGIDSGDVNVDGVDELLLTTTHGVHVLQPDLHEAMGIVAEGLEAVDGLQVLQAALDKEMDTLRELQQKQDGGGQEEGGVEAAPAGTPPDADPNSPTQ